MKKISVFFCYLYLLTFFLNANFIEEEIQQDFVIETKKIEIPNFFGAFNPSIIKWKKGFLLSFRVRNNKLVSTFEIGFVRLDEQFKPIGPAQILDIRSKSSNKFQKEQDPRLVLVGENLYIVYSNDIEVFNEDVVLITRRIFISQINFDGVHFKANVPECLYKFEGETSKWEKNWVPFDFNNDLLLAYSLSPHKIFKPINGTCETVSISNKNIPWQWGELRGGTPALKINDNQYLAFFHSSIKIATKHSKGTFIPHYVMGAYLFDAEPPFEITHISPFPIVAKKFYSGIRYNTYRPVCVVFPGGFIIEKDSIWIAYGRQDHEVWLIQLDKEKLLKSLMAF